MYAAVSAKQSGYGNHVIRTPRDNEYSAFSRVTAMLRRAAEAGSRADEIEAVGKNNELWTILAADLSNASNGLPEDLRARLLSLALFSLRHGHAVLARKLSTQPLVEVNLAIMQGLRGEAPS